MRLRSTVMLLASFWLIAIISPFRISLAGGMLVPRQSFHQVMDKAMSTLDQGMKKADMTGNPDHDFAVMMIPHHNGAIDMAKAELLYGKNLVLRRIAQEIIVTQQQEIVVMRRELTHMQRSTPAIRSGDRP